MALPSQGLQHIPQSHTQSEAVSRECALQAKCRHVSGLSKQIQGMMRGSTEGFHKVWAFDLFVLAQPSNRGLELTSFWVIERAVPHANPIPWMSSWDVQLHRAAETTECHLAENQTPSATWRTAGPPKQAPSSPSRRETNGLRLVARSDPGGVGRPTDAQHRTSKGLKGRRTRRTNT